MLTSSARIFMIGLMSLMLLSAVVPAAAAQGNSEAVRLCQGTGYLNYTDANGNPFKNVGQCVKYAAQGNTLLERPQLGGGAVAVCTAAPRQAVNYAGCDLRGAILFGADLAYANLSNANLSGVNLRGTNLYRANLTGANLYMAGMHAVGDLTYVLWGNTTCPDGTNSNNNGGTCLGHLIGH